MIGKANQKADEGVMISGPREPDVGRRNIGAMLLAAIGAAGIAGCASATGEALESVGESAAALANITIGWVDTVLGAFPSSSRTGDLALYDGGSSYLHDAVVVVAKGCVTKGDGGGGLFYWDTDTVTADDGGTVIVPNPTSRAGCWKRVYSGALNLAWFGASPAATGQDNAIALINALKNVASAGGGTIQVSQLYPLGYSGWTGIVIGVTGGTIVAPIHGLTLEGTTVGAGFTYMSTSSAFNNEGLNLTGCDRLTIRNLTLDGSANGTSSPLAICFVYMQRCKEVRIEGNRFTNGAWALGSHGGIFTFWADSGKTNRYENNLFQNFGGVVIGYVNNEHQHEEGAQFVGNRLDTAAASHTSCYTNIRNGVIANNCFSNMLGGALMVQNNLIESECTSNLAIAGNSFFDCDFGIRTDSGVSADVLPMRGIAITGNVIERCRFYAIFINKCVGLTILGNVIRDCALDSAGSTVVEIKGVSEVVVSDNVIAWTLEAAPKGIGIDFGSNHVSMQGVVIDGNRITGYSTGIRGGTDPNIPAVVCEEVVISNNLIRCRPASSGNSYGIHIYRLTQRVRIFNNQVDGTMTSGFMSSSTCQMFGNKIATMLLYPDPDLNITYYWEEEKGRKTYRPAPTAPTVPPTGVTWSVGDLQYNSDPQPGEPVGWVYTFVSGTGYAWSGFGVIV